MIDNGKSWWRQHMGSDPQPQRIRFRTRSRSRALFRAALVGLVLPEGAEADVYDEAARYGACTCPATPFRPLRLARVGNRSRICRRLRLACGVRGASA